MLRSRAKVLERLEEFAGTTIHHAARIDRLSLAPPLCNLVVNLATHGVQFPFLPLYHNRVLFVRQVGDVPDGVLHQPQLISGQLVERLAVERRQGLNVLLVKGGRFPVLHLGPHEVSRLLRPVHIPVLHRVVQRLRRTLVFRAELVQVNRLHVALAEGIDGLLDAQFLVDFSRQRRAFLLRLGRFADGADQGFAGSAQVGILLHIQNPPDPLDQIPLGGRLGDMG